MIFLRRNYQGLQKNTVAAFCLRKFVDGNVQQAVEISDKWSEVRHFYLDRAVVILHQFTSDIHILAYTYYIYTFTSDVYILGFM